LLFGNLRGTHLPVNVGATGNPSYPQTPQALTQIDIDKIIPANRKPADGESAGSLRL
jgi:hypothetical protein